VDSEQMLYLLNDAGMEISSSIEDVDAVIVNTCGFIESAKSEAIENIIELGQLKAEGKIKKIIVTGCLSQRYKEEMLTELPEIDALVGTGSYKEIVDVVKAAVERDEKPVVFGDINAVETGGDRVVTTGDAWAYLKIAEGCSNCCAYCVIPSLRGKYRSRPMEDILSEAQELAAMGVKELVVVAQDITRYGTDLYGEKRLSALINKLSEIDGVEWIRLHYLYPEETDDELIRTVAENPKVLKYLDIPIQHINDNILKAMNRRGTGAEIRELFKKLRREIPGVVLRTSVISGLPGEGEAEFEELCDFLREAKIERAGVFPFSPEEGTPAANMDYPDADTANRRTELIMELQSDIMDEFNESRMGTVVRVLCEGYDRLAECWYGRSFAESPDVDGKIFFTGKNIRPDTFVDVQITDTIDGDLMGEAVGEGEEK
jgi:ribosomal protein S12 methylthiotransferase